MTTTTKAVAWIGAIFGVVSLLVLALIIGAMMYAGYRNAEQQRNNIRRDQLKQGLAQDLQSLSKMEIKPMTGDDIRKWLSGATRQHQPKMNLSSLLPTFVCSANNLHNVLLPVCLVLGFGGLVYKSCGMYRERSLQGVWPYCVKMVVAFCALST